MTEERTVDTEAWNCLLSLLWLLGSSHPTPTPSPLILPAVFAKALVAWAVRANTYPLFDIFALLLQHML